MRKRFRKFSYRDIAPDEIFLDARNAPRFDKHQLEGRLEKPISERTPRMVGGLFLLVVLIFSGQLFLLQVKNGDAYLDQSENNSLRHDVLFADRGIIYDRNGVELAWNEPNTEDEYSLRKYNSLSGLAHVLGYVTYPQKDERGYYFQQEYVGTTGVEEGYEELLSGENGIRIRERDVFLDVVSESTINEPHNGDDVILTIDARVQHNLYEFIRDLALRTGFQGGAGVLMDIHTGEIIALTSYPEYSPQVMTDGDDRERINRYLENQYTPFLNRATNGLYTPGSIVKPFVALGALNEEVITPEKTILSTGSIRLPNPYNPELFSIFTDWKAHGNVNVKDALAVSSNIYFYEVAGGYEDQIGIGITKLEEYIRAFGVGERTNIKGISEVDGVVPNPDWKEENFEDGVWRVGDTYNTAIGQYGFQVTPIQMARAVAGIASGGELVRPKINLNEKTQKSSVSINVSSEHLETVQDGMRLGVTAGIAQALNVPFVKVAAKTGTAELGVSKKLVNSWITGFYPYLDPQYAFAVVMERGPSTNLTGAVFVMRNLLEWMALEAPEYLE